MTRKTDTRDVFSMSDANGTTHANMAIAIIRDTKKHTPVYIIIILLSVFAGLLLLMTGCSDSAQGASFNVSAKDDIVNDDEIHEKTALTHPSFITKSELSAVLANTTASSSALSSPSAIDGRIVSAVIPHHLTAARLITNVMQLLADQKPDLIVLIGPNHANKGNPIITGTYAWQTPEGIVETAGTAVDLLLSQHLAVKDEAVLSKEHSIGSLVPLIRHYLPGTRIVPIILHHGVNRQEVDSLLEALKPILTDKTVLISSVDFSHYLTRNEAQTKDQETLSYMKQFDYPALFRLNSDYLDSPASLTAAFRLAEKQGIKEFTLLDNTNSGIILQNDDMETTSYFTLVFTAN